jgi:DNA polymerase-4
VKKAPRRAILHVDLDPFLVSVERSLDPTLRGRPVIVGGQPDGSGIVAAVSAEARARGVRPGLPVGTARRVCPDGAFRPGDLDTYARYAQDVTSILQAWSRRVERPSADEAYVDLTPEGPTSPSAVPAAEKIKDELQRRLGLDASLGLASTRMAARVASTCARPRGLLVVLPGYEASFLARQPLSFLPDLPPHLESALRRGGLETLGAVAEADREALEALVGPVAAERLQATATGEGEEPIPVTAPPTSIQEEILLRDRRARVDRDALEGVLDGLVRRAWSRLRPFELGAGTVALEVRRGEGGALRRQESLDPPIADEETLRAAVRNLAGTLLDHPATVRGLQVRLGRLQKHDPQPWLFPGAPAASRR